MRVGSAKGACMPPPLHLPQGSVAPDAPTQDAGRSQRGPRHGRSCRADAARGSCLWQLAGSQAALDLQGLPESGPRRGPGGDPHVGCHGGAECERLPLSSPQKVCFPAVRPTRPFACCRSRLYLPLLQALFPGDFDQLVRVYNHKNVDLLLSKHDATASHRDVLVTRAGKARRALEAARETEAAAAASFKATGKDGNGSVMGGGPQVLKAIAKLEALQAEIAIMDLKVEELEEEIEKAQEEALSKPLGTAFFALFK